MYSQKGDTAKLMPRYVRSTYKEYQDSIIWYCQFGKQIDKFLDMPTLLLCTFKPKTDKTQ